MSLPLRGRSDTADDVAVIDATILIPTHDHARFLPCAVRSALVQKGASVEVLVVGDGVGDDTRTAMQPFLDDRRTRFFDFPKGERHGERHRHVALQEARGDVVCYLSDDDVLLPGHVLEMSRLLADADLVHSPPVSVFPDGDLRYRPADLARPEFLEAIREGRNNFIGLTGASHSRSTYVRLPYGWRPAPSDLPTDAYMWMQVCALPGFRGATARRLTAIHFPDSAWRAVDDLVRAEAVEAWLERALSPGGEEEIQATFEDAVWRAAQDYKLRSLALGRSVYDANVELDRLRAPWPKRLARHVRSLGSSLARSAHRS